LSHLSDGDVKLLLCAVLQFRRIVEIHSSPIGVVVRLDLFREGREQISSGFPSLDVMIRHDHVHYVVGTPLGHVASRAILRRSMPVGGNQLLHNCGMAAKTDASIVPRGFLASGYVVWVMAGSA
jgi:hypothetical protein